MIQYLEMNFWNFRNVKDLAGKWHEEYLYWFHKSLELVGKTIWQGWKQTKVIHIGLKDVCILVVLPHQTKS